MRTDDGESSIGHLEQWSVLTPDWAQVRGSGPVFDLICRLQRLPSLSARCFGWNTADGLQLYGRGEAFPASPGGECCRPGSGKPILARAARCRSFARSDRPARSAALRTHARCERVSGSWRGSLALAPKTAGGCADRVAGAVIGGPLAYPGNWFLCPFDLGAAASSLIQGILTLTSKRDAHSDEVGRGSKSGMLESGILFIAGYISNGSR
jgi:hypothetical protein